MYQTEKQLKELGDKVPGEVKTKVEAKVNELKEIAAKDDVEGTKKAIDELQKEVSVLSMQGRHMSWCSPYGCICWRGQL